jgi:hypothetical protein
MRLGFDLDGTVADLHGALAREAAGMFPDLDPASLPQSIAPTGDPLKEGSEEPPQKEAAPSTRSLTSRQQREIWRAACARVNFWEELDEIEPGALARLFRLVQERRWEVIFLTSRPESSGDTAQAQSHRWLIKHGFTSPSVFVVHGSRGKIAAALALDIVVDDRPENCLDVAIDSTARAILVWRDDAAQVPGSARQLGIGSVKSIHECLNILEELDRADTEQIGMVERLKRLLGLKPRSARLRNAGHQDAAAAAAATRGR